MDFDLNPDTFTLDNMFAMELHRFTDIIQDIVGSAVKELSIEKGITEVAETWGNMKFTVYKYMKGTQERGKQFSISPLFCKVYYLYTDCFVWNFPSTRAILTGKDFVIYSLSLGQKFVTFPNNVSLVEG